MLDENHLIYNMQSQKPMLSYGNLESDMICYVDTLGESYLMPCLAQNPC